MIRSGPAVFFGINNAHDAQLAEHFGCFKGKAVCFIYLYSLFPQVFFCETAAHVAYHQLFFCEIKLSKDIRYM